VSTGGVIKMLNELNLRSLRGDKSLSEVAKEIGITPQGLGKIELKKRTPSLFIAKKIADYYGVFIEQIFFDNNRDETSLKTKGA